MIFVIRFPLNLPSRVSLPPIGLCDGVPLLRTGEEYQD